MTKFDKITQIWQHNQNTMQQKWNSLPSRDRLALLVLTIFLVLFIFGFGSWELHQKANRSQKAYDNAITDLFWLRSQANNINPTQSTHQNTTEIIQQIFSQAGISAQIIENAGKIQLQFYHTQGSVISNILGQIDQQGFIILQLQMAQPNIDRIEVQAIISQNP